MQRSPGGEGIPAFTGNDVYEQCSNHWGYGVMGSCRWVWSWGLGRGARFRLRREDEGIVSRLDIADAMLRTKHERR